MDFELSERRRRGKTIPLKKTLSLQVRRSVALLLGTLIMLTVLLSIIYLLNTTHANQNGYTLSQAQLHKDDLLLQERHLVNEITDATSYNSIEESDVVQQMVTPETTYYIEAPPEVDSPE